MYQFFSNFYNKPLGWGLFNRDTEDGTPSPPDSQVLLNNAGIVLVNNNDEILIK
jgi:hypothetical protein